jgi:hypothetical protein
MWFTRWVARRVPTAPSPKTATLDPASTLHVFHTAPVRTDAEVRVLGSKA